MRSLVPKKHCQIEDLDEETLKNIFRDTSHALFEACTTAYLATCTKPLAEEVFPPLRRAFSRQANFVDIVRSHGMKHVNHNTSNPLDDHVAAAIASTAKRIAEEKYNVVLV